MGLILKQRQVGKTIKFNSIHCLDGVAFNGHFLEIRDIAGSFSRLFYDKSHLFLVGVMVKFFSIFYENSTVLEKINSFLKVQ